MYKIKSRDTKKDKNRAQEKTNNEIRTTWPRYPSSRNQPDFVVFNYTRSVYEAHGLFNRSRAPDDATNSIIS